ncbi:sugar ABC transporter permease [Paenibacillus sp. TRM 82003]|uniref:carbohydrate ABC transporter permease n=1 Tax=Kineococcus sp. TRM81007 TaxID=2925831 RepID=UPI001F5A2C34|nr:sugar ABC transporter permease [Kineococcus sp. TRM81007]MCI2239312.1 sugar ABC transporter permease [Kineococcus sp. TRM81007]MCI3924996.1 sugar ABC transporter permease [Paenibacillus sp. TRM 82003]
MRAPGAEAPASRRVPRTTPRTATRRPVRRWLTSYALLAPALVLFGLFVLYPLVQAVRISMTDSTGIGEARFTGLDNYARMVGDPVFWRAAGNTVLLALVSVPTSVATGFGLALLLRERLPARGLFRALFLAPYVLSGVVVAMAGRWIFDQEVGVVDRALTQLGLPAPDWQSSGAAAAVSVFVVLFWARTGLVVVLYLSALQGVDRDVLEAAELDGASRRQRVRYVTWPLLRPTTFFVVVLMVVEVFQTFDVVRVMTGGGPAGATEILVTYAYAQGFQARAEGYGSAIGVVVFSVVLLATVVAWWVQRDSEEVA